VDEAAEAYGAVITLTPGRAAAHANLGVVLRRLGRPNEALASYGRAIAADPGNANAWYNRGNLLSELKRADEAIADYDQALAIQPGAPVIEASRANALRLAGRLDEALAAYDRAVAADPEMAFAHDGRGAVLFTLGRAEDALAAHERAVAADPRLALAHRNRGMALWKLGRYEDAIESYDRAEALDPADAAAAMFRGLCRLTLGRFAEGWRDYERRWEVEEALAAGAGQATAAVRARFRPGLDVDELAGREVLVVGEQGVGDVIMFASLIPELAATAGRVSLHCDARLRRLFAESFPGVRLVDAQAAARELPGFDAVLGIGSLARLFRNRAQDFPGAPYLRPRAEVRERWALRLGSAEGRRRIGVSWRGGTAGTRASERSLTMAQLQPILDLPNCEFVSLQYGAGAAEAAATPLRLFPAQEIDDFEDLAGLVASLDLIVTVQTSLAHLTGACGAPGLVLIPATPEWRYGASGPTTPWYGSLELFRQTPGEDWAAVVRRLADEAVRRLDL
jgi:Tfp pilus assembly protein PilF/ADP-heptose:LPS heptosyltransferase